MESHLSLLLVCTLFSSALSLTCHQCIPTATGSCVSTQTSCSDQCLTSTMAIYVEDTKMSDVSIKTCSMPGYCSSGSLNLGKVKVLANGKCCSTDLCNSETLPAPSKQTPNGRVCYGCDENGCSAKVNCEGSEDRCIAASVQQGSSSVSMKGCASRSICTSSGSTSVPGFGISKVECCEGNLCNGAESFTRSFLLVLVPLLSSSFLLL